MSGLTMQSRKLNMDEVKRLVASQAAKDRHEASRSSVGSWPGEYNMRLLAEAVSERKKFVKFDDGQQFTIKYNDVRKDVYIRPSDNNFVPCGYFSYQKIKEAMVD